MAVNTGNSATYPGNVVNNAEKFSPGILEIFMENSYIAPFIVSNVEWLDAKTFHFTQMSVTGYKTHKLTGGWNAGKITQTDKAYELTMDRDISFFVDKREVDETNKTASEENISRVFEQTQATPEKDAYFFSKTATEAIDNGLASTSALTDWTADNVVTKLVGLIGKVRRYRGKGLIFYVRPEIMDLLALAKDFTKTIDTTALVSGGRAIETRITSLNGVVLIEVIDEDRFMTAFDFTDGFEATEEAKKINVLATTPLTNKFVPKINSIYMFAPGQHTEGDGYLYQNRAHYDDFIFPNGKDGNIDSIYVDYEA